jgi:hypothetical protein
MTNSRRRVLPLPLRWAAGLALAILAVPQPAVADQPTVNDIRLTLRARQALYQNKELAPLNLGVSVRAGVAVLWGRVPSVAASKRAEALVRKVPGVLEVHSELQISPPDDPMSDFLHRVISSGHGPTVESLLHETCRPSLAPRWPDDPVPPSHSATPAVTLMPPILVAPPPTDVSLAPASAQPGRLVLSIEQLREGDARYQGMRAEVQGDVVRLRGVVWRWEDLASFTRQLSTFPGVRLVLTGDVHLETGTPGRE